MIILACIVAACATTSVAGTLVFPQIGVVLEPDILSIHSTRDVYTTLVFKIHTPHTVLRTTPCALGDYINGISGKFNATWSLLRGLNIRKGTEACKTYSQLCDPYSSTSSDSNLTKETLKSRSKRMVPIIGALVGVAGLGLAIRNSFELGRIERSVETVKNQQDKIVEFINRDRNETSHHIDLVHQLVIAESQIRRKEMHDVLATLCDLQRAYAAAFANIHIELIANEFHALVKTLLEGKIDPKLVSRDVIKGLTVIGGPLAGTLYETDLDLFYHLTVPYVVEFDELQGTIHLLLQTPHAIDSDLAPIIRVNNFGFIEPESGTMLKANLPKQFFLLSDKKDYIPLPVNPTTCVKRNSLMVCRHKTPEIPKSSKCLKQLLKGTKLDACTFTADSSVSKGVFFATKSAVLIRGKKSVLVTKSTRHITDSQRVELDPTALTVYQYSEFESLVVDDHQFVSPQSQGSTMESSGAGLSAFELNISNVNLSLIEDDATITVVHQLEDQIDWCKKEQISHSLSTLTTVAKNGHKWFWVLLSLTISTLILFLLWQLGLLKVNQVKKEKRLQALRLLINPVPKSDKIHTHEEVEVI